jgi:outer membrane protein assembly factor BamB
LQKSILIFGIFLLFIFSSLIPITFGIDIEIKDIKMEIFNNNKYFNHSQLYYQQEYKQYNFNTNYNSINFERVKIFNDFGQLSNGGPMNSAWPLFCYDIYNTGRSPNGKNGSPGVVKWKFWLTEGLFEPSPVIDKNGTIYIGTLIENYLFAIYQNGTEKWRCKLDGGVDYSSAAIAEDGTIYVGTYEGNLCAVNPNGTMKWSYYIGAQVQSAPTIDEDGIIYAASKYSERLSAIYPNGTLKWNFDMNNLVQSSPALKDGVVYLGSRDHYLYSIYTSNGTLKWKHNTGHWCGGHGATIDKDGSIYLGAVDGSLYAVYSNGTRKWKNYLGVNLVSSPGIGYDGNIYVAAYKEHDGAIIYCLTPDGEEIWRYETEGTISASPAIDEFGNIYIGDWYGNFYSFSSDGILKWKLKVGDGIHGSASIGEDGTVYFASWDSYLYAIEIMDNQGPVKPTIDGTQNGSIYKSYTFTATTTDPDDDKISYLFDWGDETISVWTLPLISGNTVQRNHIWTDEGTYMVRVKAKDIHGAMSPWSDPLTVTMPRNKIVTNNFILYLLEHFPVLQKILSTFPTLVL